MKHLEGENASSLFIMRSALRILHFHPIVSSPFLIPVFFILAILVCPGVLGSQDAIKTTGPSLTASLDRDSATIGSNVVLTLRYRLPEGAGFFDIPEIKGLENLTQVDRDIGPGAIRITLLVDQLGSWKTGHLSVSYLDKEGMTRSLTADPVSLTVLSNLGVKPEEAELRPIQGIIPTASLWLKYLPWFSGLLGLLLLVFGLIWWQKRRRRNEAFAMAQEPPYVRAKRELEELEAQGLFERGQSKAFYFCFSEILRRYLEALRGFPAAEFTTEEISARLRHEKDRKLLPILRQADLVKFADTVPTTARKEEEVKAALTYIHETRPAQEADQPVAVAQRAKR
jgi:hypothetical protein